MIIEALDYTKSKINHIATRAFEADYEPRYRYGILSLDMVWCSGFTPLSNVLYYLDWRLWMYSSITFRSYIGRIKDLNLPVVVVFESPFGYEFPKNVLLESFSKELYERTSYVIDQLAPNTKLISAAVDCMPDHNSEMMLGYLDYFSSGFDSFGVNCCFMPTPQNLAKLDLFLTRLTKMHPKALRVLKWAVPASDRTIRNPRRVDGVSVAVPDSTKAASRMLETYRLVERIGRQQVSWFVSHSTDLYGVYDATDDFWIDDSEMLIRPSECNGALDYWHFLGTVDSDGNKKQPILDMVSSLESEAI